jgi:hypothetical protein
VIVGLFFNRNKISILLSSLTGKKEEEEDKLFENIYSYDNVKRLFRMALESNDHTTTSILLSGPPASDKTVFLQSLMKFNDSYFIDCSKISC